MRWIETNKKGVSFRMIELPDGSFAIGIIGLSPADTAWQKAVSEYGFKVSRSGRVLLRRAPVKLNEVRALFPQATVVDLPREQVYVYRKRPSDRSVLPDTQASVFLGKNYLGQDVYASPTGTRYVKGRDGQPMSEAQVAIAPVFLRFRRPEELDLCADGFVLRMETEFLRADDLRAFCAIVHGEDKPVAPTDSRLREVQEAVEAAVFRRVQRIFQETGDFEATFRAAASLYERSPGLVFRTSTSVALQQYSTPITLSIAAQYALGDVQGLSVLEPTIGNASLVSALSGARITGVEIDPARYQRAKAALTQHDGLDSESVNVICGDFLQMAFEQPFDAVIANPPFGALEKPVVEDLLKVTRLDHLILLKALRHRKDDGRAVFIIGADRESLFNPGEISGGSARLFAWLADHYEVRAFEVSGDLYRKQGASYPVRVVAVGRKRSEEEIWHAKTTRAFRINRLSCVDTLEALWEEAKGLRAFLEESSPREKARADASETKAERSDLEARVENDYQTQYVPMTPLPTTAMIPKNLAAPQQAAFRRFLREHPDPIAFVKQALQMDDLSSFEAEQIDAIALGIWNMKRGRALILADQTGMGKGRVVAAIARWAAINGLQCNFLTEKSGLFSDFWRDVRDIGSEDMFTPFIMNDGEQIVSLSGESQQVLVPKTPASVRNQLLASEAPPIEAGYNLMLATYSQFNRPEAKSLKSRYIKTAAQDSVIILDEAHVAAGDSNTGRNLTEAVMTSRAALYSSATFAKHARNISLYHKAFPQSVDLESLKQTLRAGGEPLQEVLSAMLCEDGVLLRREQDLSRLKFATLEVPPHILARNERISDQVSEILAAMSYLSGDVEKLAMLLDKALKKRLEGLSEEQRQGSRLGVSYVNFGSRLYTISRQMALVLSTELVAESAIRALENGQKPVIVLEQTMESALAEVSGEVESAAEDAEEAEQKRSPLTIRDLMRRLLDKIVQVSYTDDYGLSKKVSIFDLAQDAESLQQAIAAVDALREMIDALPEIPAMPIDEIKHRIVKAGYTCGEVSGRKTTYTWNEDGTVTAHQETRDRNREIFRFNSGAYDAIILTRSGCSGLSLHASEKFADQRQRVLIEAQIAANVSERMQFFGRVNRRGQVSVPEIWSVTSGLPWEVRILAMQNAKLRKLSANTQSNRNNAAEMKDIPDILNPVGNEVCKTFLLVNPDIAKRLDIDLDVNLDDDEQTIQSDDDCFFVNKLTGRLCLLRVEEQRRIYAAIMDAYQKQLADLSLKGINPFEAKVLDIKAKVVDRKCLMPGGEHDSVFDAPVYAEKIEWTREVEPMRAAQVVKMANLSMQKLCETGWFKPEERSRFDLPFTQQMRLNAIRDLDLIRDLMSVDPTAAKAQAMARFREAMLRAVPARFENKADPEKGVEAALCDKGMNAVKRLDMRARWLYEHIDSLMPGCPIRFSTEEGATTGIILAVNPPSPDKMHYLGAWHIKVLPTGAQTPLEMTYNALIDDAEFGVCDYHEAYTALERAPRGQLKFSKWVLSGNLFRAVELTAKSGIGRLGIYTDEKGYRHRAVLCRAKVKLDDLFSMEVSLSVKDAKQELASRLDEQYEGEIDFGNHIRLCWEGERMRLVVPGTKSVGGRVFLNEKVLQYTGEFSGSRKVMQAVFERPQDLEGFVSALYEAGLSLRKRIDQPTEHKPRLAA